MRGAVTAALLLALLGSVQGQDFMSLFGSLLGSGLGGGGGGGGGGNPAAGFMNFFQPQAGGGGGGGLPFGEFINLGTQLAQGFKKPPPPRPAPPRPAPAAPRPPPAPAPAPAPRPAVPPPMPTAEDYEIDYNVDPAPAKKPKHIRDWHRRQQQKRLTPRQLQAQRRAQHVRKQQQIRQRQQRLQQQQRRAQAARAAAARQRKPAVPAHLMPATAAQIDAEYEDDIDLALTGARNMPPPQAPQPTRAAPPPPAKFMPNDPSMMADPITPINRAARAQPDPFGLNSWAKVFQPAAPRAHTLGDSSLMKPFPTAAPPPRTPPPFTFATFAPFTFDQIKFNPVTAAPTARAVTVAPVAAVTSKPLPTLPPFDLDKFQGKNVFFDNTASMLKEIASFSDSHAAADQDYSSVQRLMGAFADALADTNKVQKQPVALNDGTEFSVNRKNRVARNLFESDMVLTVQQLKGIVLAEQERGRGRSKRKVITGAVYRWPKTQAIPYKFSERRGGDESWKRLIRSALKHWESETCVRWSENAPGKDHVVFIRGAGCYSSVGRTGGQQSISIGYGCEDKGIITHEVGHSLGFWHEQSRPDREQYINIVKQYLARGTESNFVRRTELEIEYMGLPYDVGSVMHYGPQAFTTDWDHDTIETRDKRYMRTIGQRARPSFIDVKQVNRLYCNDQCPGANPCKHGGYPDPNNCRRCKCPDGLGGMHCDALPEDRECGGELTATGVWQEISHSGKLKKCNWRIKTNNARIRVILSKVQYRCETTCKAFVEIKHNSDFQQTGFRACCDKDKEITVVSDQAEVLIISDAHAVTYDTQFSIRYIQDSGAPLPVAPPPLPAWKPGTENRAFRGSETGPVEKFILAAIPKIRDANRPFESIASIVTEYSIATLLGVKGRK